MLSLVNLTKYLPRRELVQLSLYERNNEAETVRNRRESQSPAAGLLCSGVQQPEDQELI